MKYDELHALRREVACAMNTENADYDRSPCPTSVYNAVMDVFDRMMADAALQEMRERDAQQRARDAERHAPPERAAPTH